MNIYIIVQLAYPIDNNLVFQKVVFIYDVINATNYGNMRVSKIVVIVACSLNRKDS